METFKKICGWIGVGILAVLSFLGLCSLRRGSDNVKRGFQSVGESIDGAIEHNSEAEELITTSQSAVTDVSAGLGGCSDKLNTIEANLDRAEELISSVQATIGRIKKDNEKR